MKTIREWRIVCDSRSTSNTTMVCHSHGILYIYFALDALPFWTVRKIGGDVVCVCARMLYIPLNSIFFGIQLKKQRAAVKSRDFVFEKSAMVARMRERERVL